MSRPPDPAGTAPEIHRYLGAARVVQAAGTSLVVALEEVDAPTGSIVVRAMLALAFPYRPVAGDQLLIVGDARAFYAIGVLEGRGQSQLSHDGNIALRAEGGRLRVAGARGVRLGGRAVAIEARQLRRVALAAVQTFRQQRSHVREESKLEAGEVDELSQDRWLLRTRRAVIKALHGARLKGSTVRLG
jgi:hypothetical protein